MTSRAVPSARLRTARDIRIGDYTGSCIVPTGRSLSARAAQVVRCQLLDARACRRHSDDIPQHLWRHAVAPDPTGLVDRPEHLALDAEDADSRFAQVRRAFVAAAAFKQE